MEEVMKDIKVVELASVLAGPLAGNLFSELGAQVIKIENKRTEGDITRRWRTASEDSNSAVSSYYAAAKYKKEVLMADLSLENDRAVVMQLIEAADVVISNFKRSSAVKLGFGYEQLRKVNPRAIIAELVGYKHDANKAAFDVLLQAETGYLSMTGHEGQPFAKIPVAMIDVLAAHQLRTGIMTALFLRERDGQGRRVEVDLYGSALSGLINQASAYLMNGDVAGPMGSQHPSIAPYGEVFVSADGVPMVLAVGTDEQFASLMDILGIAVEKEQWGTNALRVRHRSSLSKVLTEAISHFTFENLAAALAQRGVPCAKVSSIDEALEGEEARENILSFEQEGREAKVVKSVTFQLSSERAQKD
jgi:crotonobetainyl-CoA:carnitine CoA-transferase CaiB-like acyl-CoA transferase